MFITNPNDCHPAKGSAPEIYSVRKYRWETTTP